MLFWETSMTLLFLAFLLSLFCCALKLRVKQQLKATGWNLLFGGNTKEKCMFLFIENNMVKSLEVISGVRADVPSFVAANP